jgi:hypothetical protein
MTSSEKKASEVAALSDSKKKNKKVLKALDFTIKPAQNDWKPKGPRKKVWNQIDKDEFERLVFDGNTCDDIAYHFARKMNHKKERLHYSTLDFFCKRTYGKKFREVQQDLRGVTRVALRNKVMNLALQENHEWSLKKVTNEFLGWSEKMDLNISGELTNVEFRTAWARDVTPIHTEALPAPSTSEGNAQQPEALQDSCIRAAIGKEHLGN